MNIKEESKRRAKNILKAIHESSLAIRWKDTETQLIRRDNSQVADYSDVGGQRWLKVYILENILHGLVNLALEERSDLETIILEIASGNNQGIRYPRTLNFTIKNDKMPKRYSDEVRGIHTADKIQSTLDMTLKETEGTYVTKSYILGSMIFARHNFGSMSNDLVKTSGVYNTEHVEDSRALVLLDDLLNKDLSGLLHDVYHIDRNLIYYYTSTNALMVMALALSGHFKLAEQKLDYLKRTAPHTPDGFYWEKFDLEQSEQMGNGQAFGSFLIQIADVMCGNREEAFKFMGNVDAQTPSDFPINADLWSQGKKPESLGDYHLVDIKATSAYAILRNMLGDKKRAFEKMDTLHNFKGEYQTQTPMKKLLSFNPRIFVKSSPYLYAALAYADLSREHSFFDTRILNASTAFPETSAPNTTYLNPKKIPLS